MLSDILLFLPLCAVTSVVYQLTRDDNLSTLLRRARHTFILWTAGMAAVAAVVLLLSWAV
jgi:hypothetical protein